MSDHSHWVQQHRFKMLLISLSLLLLAHPIAERWPHARVLFHLLFDLVLLVSLLSIRRYKLGFALGVFFGIPAFLSFWSRISFPRIDALTSREFDIFGNYAMGIFLAIIAVYVLRSVFEGREVTTDRLCGALSVFLLFGITWGFFYTAIELKDPGSFRFGEGLLTPGLESTDADYERSSVLFYYSFVSLTTLGFGDVTPTTSVTRTLTMWEAILGQAYLAVLVARLVGLHVSRSADV